MSRQAAHWLGFVVILLTLPFLLAIGQYRFTYDNPSIGDPNAPYRLEYFSIPGCSACREFESIDLEALVPLIDAGRLYLVYRDLPSFADDTFQDRQTFCLQEHGGYLHVRRKLRSQPDFNISTLPRLSRLGEARYRECLTSSAIPSIWSHNHQDFERRGFVATPSFTLVASGASPVTRTHWTGRPRMLALIRKLNPSEGET